MSLLSRLSVLRRYSTMSPRYITQAEAQKIDEDLMSLEGAYSLDQLMELAGLAVAQSMSASFPLEKYKKVLVLCGPGNQGGDGLVAARHLSFFGYDVGAYVPKPGKKDIYQRLTRQCENLKIPFVQSVEEFEKELKSSDAVLDAIFGFSFKPPVRAPFDSLLTTLSKAPQPILSVDIPSGWDVGSGDQPLENEQGEKVPSLQPQVLISLTAPKEGVKEFKGRHWLGGRFVPPDVAEKYNLNIPPYPGSDQIVEL